MVVVGLVATVALSLVAGYYSVAEPVIALGVVLGAVGLAIGSAKLEYGLYLLLAYAPFATYIKRLFYIAFPESIVPATNNLVTLVPELALYGLVGHFLFGVVAGTPGSRLHWLTRSWLDRCVLIALLWSILEMLNPGSTLAHSLYGFRSGYQYLFVYFVVAYVANRVGVQRAVLTIFLVTGIAVTAYAAWQQVHGYYEYEALWLAQAGGEPVAGERVETAPGEIRPFSTMGATSSVGGYMAMATILTVAWLRHSSGRLRLALLFVLPLMIGGLLLSTVKSGIIGTGVGLAIVLPFTGRRPRAVNCLVSLALLVACSFAAAPFFEYLSETTSTEIMKQQFLWMAHPFDAPTYEARVLGTAIRVEFIKQHLLGVGTGASEDFDFAGIRSMYMTDQLSDLASENTWVTWLAEQGIVGVAALAAVMVMGFVTGLRIMYRAREPDDLVAGVVAMGITVSMSIISWASSPLMSREPSIIFWAALGLASAVDRRLSGELVEESLAVRQPE